MRRKKILQDIDERIEKLSKVITSIENGDQNQYYKTEKCRQSVINYQLGFIDALKVIKTNLTK